MVHAILTTLKQKRFYFVSIGAQVIKDAIRKYNPFLTFFFKLKFRFDGQLVQTVQSTSYQHVYIYHLASYRGQPLTTGSRTFNGNKMEIMNLESGEWTTGPDYPFHDK